MDNLDRVVKMLVDKIRDELDTLDNIPDEELPDMIEAVADIEFKTGDKAIVTLRIDIP